MSVFTTLLPEKIDLSRTQARAVQDLKHFLEYAERGASAIAASTNGSQGDFESPFEIAVARALQQKGWNVHAQIGVSAYRIDLGIVNPDEPGVYLAGVECDGAMYHSSRYARERDKIRQSVLEGLGWTLFRVWSTDWWTNQQKAIDTIDKALTERLVSLREAKQVDTISIETFTEEPTLLYADRLIPENTTTQSQIQNLISTYSVCDLTGFSVNPDEFYQATYDVVLVSMIFEVINHEGPIHEELLVKRIARAHGFKRAGRQIRERVIKIASQSANYTIEDVGTFYWPENSDLSHCMYARTSGRDEDTKKLDYICKEEIKQIYIQSNDAGQYVELTKALGISRVTQQTKARLDSII